MIYISRNLCVVLSSDLKGVPITIYISRNSCVVLNAEKMVEKLVIYISRNLIMYMFYIYIVTHFLFFINCLSYLYIIKRKPTAVGFINIIRNNINTSYIGI